MKTTLKRCLSFLLTLAMVLSLPLIPMVAYAADLTLEFDQTSYNVLQSTSDQTVDVTLRATEAFPVAGAGTTIVADAGIEIVWTSIKGPDGVVLTGGGYNAADGTISWESSDAENIQVTDLFTVTVKVPANTAAGNYNLAFNSIEINYDYGTETHNAATSMTATVTVSEVTGPQFSVYYVLQSGLTDGDSDNWGEKDPGQSFTADVYISADSAQTLQGFEIYPVAETGLSWVNNADYVTGYGYTPEVENTYFAFHNTNKQNPASISITTEGTKVATLNFSVTADAVYDEHMKIYFGEESNLAIAGTPGSVVIPVTPEMSVAGGIDIDTDGSANVGVETRKLVTVTFNGNGADASSSMAQQEVLYNKATALNANTYTKHNYTFQGWATNSAAETVVYADGASVTLTADTPLYAVWQKEYSDYTVKHWQQNADDEGYTEVEADRQTLNGKTGENTAATANSYANFTAKDFEQVEITEDDAAVVNIYYDRATFLVSYKYTGDVPANADPLPTDVSYRFGATVTVEPVPADVAGYTFIGWTAPSGVTVTNGSFVMPTNAVEFNGDWGYGTVFYYVEHYFQNIEDDDYTIDNQLTETKQGTTESQTAAAAKTVTGFTSQPFDQETISANGDTVVKIYYNRNKHFVSYQYEGAEPSGAPEITQAPYDAKEYKYGAEVPVATKPVRAGYTASDWTTEPDVTITNNNTFTMPDSDVVLKTSWTANTYNVTLDPGTNGTLPDGTTNPIAVTYNDTWDELPAPTPNPGYIFDGWYIGDNKIETGYTIDITADSIAVAHYSLQNYTITFKFNDGVTGDSTLGFTVESKDVLTDPTRANYEFKGWTISNADAESSWANDEDGVVNPAYTLSDDYGNVTLTAIWELKAKVVVLGYAYAVSGNALVLVGGAPEGDGMTFFYDDAPLYKITDSATLTAYRAKIAADYSGDVYAFIVSATGDDSAPVMTGEITVKTGTSEELDKSADGVYCDVNGDGVVNSADANAVYQMLVNKNYYTNAQLSVKNRLVADVVSENDGEAFFGSIDDVNAIIEQIRAAHSSSGQG